MSDIICLYRNRNASRFCPEPEAKELVEFARGDGHSHGTTILSLQLQPGGHVVILAGETYRAGLVDPIREMECAVEIPIQGLRIGEQLPGRISSWGESTASRTNLALS